MTSYMSVTTTLSLWKVVAVFGPRPSWALWIPTMALVIAAFNSPPLSTVDALVMGWSFGRALERAGLRGGLRAGEETQRAVLQV